MEYNTGGEAKGHLSSIVVRTSGMVHRPGENYQARGGFVIHRIVEQRPVTPDCKSGGSKGQFVKVFSLWVNHGTRPDRVGNQNLSGLAPPH